MSSSLAEQQLKKAEAQLTQVQSLLETEPSNAELLTLANDLRQAVCVAQALVRKQQQQQPPPPPTTTTSPLNKEEDGGPPLRRWTAVSAAKPQQTAASTSTTTAGGSGGGLVEFTPNAHVEVRASASSKLWQGGVVVRRLPDYTYVVLRVCDGKELTVRARDSSTGHLLVRPCADDAQLVLDRIVTGMKIRARYSADGTYYQATVTKPGGGVGSSAHGVWVKFDGYEDDDDELVLLEHCRESEPGEAPSLLLDNEEDVPPKHLAIQDGDSDDAKAKKQRQIKAWRRKLRDERIDQVHSAKQDSWLSFQASTHNNNSKRTRY